MAFKYSSNSLACIICFLSVSIALAYSATNQQLSRADFPEAFVFGTGSSAYQFEGAASEGGRGPSIWDTFSRVKGNVLGNANGNVADDQYHRYKEDISLMSTMGMDAYRFSISWPRIFPEGNGKVNEVGIAYYNNLIDGLLAKGIEPFVTLYHWDLPQKLQDSYGGWLSPNIMQDFANYVETCFQRFGDRVKYWATFNEPATFILFGYNDGTFPPQRCSPWVGNCTEGNSMTEPYIVAHNVLLSHATAVDIYRTKFQRHQKGEDGIAINVDWYIPFSNSTNDVKAVDRLLDFTAGWFLSPLLYGHYPTIMRDLVGDRLPTFTTQQKKKLRNSLDFLGLNYYTTNYVKSVDSYPNTNTTSFYQDTMTSTTGERNGVLIGPQAASDWLYIYPRGIHDLVKYIKKTYIIIPPIIITENGVDEINNASLPLNEALKDPTRVKFYSDHLSYLALAIKEGVDVRGFFAWSLLDDFEWTSGYNLRFGLHYVDYKTLERYPKESASWFKNLLKKKDV